VNTHTNVAAVAYIRVSSRAQDHATQRHAIEQATGGTIAEWYAEKRSAKTMVREGLQRLRADVRMGKVQRIFVFKLDRLCRSASPTRSSS